MEQAMRGPAIAITASRRLPVTEIAAAGLERRDFYEIYTEISLNFAMQDQTS